MSGSADDLLALEEEVVRLAAGNYVDAVARIRVLLATEPGKVRAAVLRLVAPTLGRAAVDLIGSAWGMGVEETVDDLSAAALKHPKLGRVRKSKVPSRLTTDARGLTSSSREAIAKARKMLLAGVDVAQAVAPVLADQSHVERTLRTTVNDVRNSGALMVATSTGQEVTIEAERDACAECLAYAGKTSKTGDFPGNLTFGRPKRNPPKTKTCPIHPNCRCRIVVLNSKSYAEALEREAKRSILRGYALPSESPKVRLEAADRLASKANGMPKSVNALARRAVKAGAFPDQAKPESARR